MFRNYSLWNKDIIKEEFVDSVGEMKELEKTQRIDVYFYIHNTLVVKKCFFTMQKSLEVMSTV